MPRHPARPLPRHVYPADPWQLVETAYHPATGPRTETLFALSNGYLGVRGAHEEGRPAYAPGTLIAGLHETWPIEYAETAYGLAKTGQTIIAAPDASLIKLYVDDEPLHLPTARLLDYRRVLDMRAGTLTRDLVWELPSGKQVQVSSVRLVSLVHRHISAYRYTVTVLNADAHVVISSTLLNRQDAEQRDVLPALDDPRKAKVFNHRVLRPAGGYGETTRALLGFRVANSDMAVACGFEHTVESANPVQLDPAVDDDRAKLVVVARAAAGSPVRLDKFAAHHTSGSVPTGELLDRARRTLDRAVESGFDALADAQRAWLDRVWDRADVSVDLDQPLQAVGSPLADEPGGWGGAELAQTIRWSLFQLIQAGARTEDAGIPAKGLTGAGYEGQYFWDTEIYVNPFLTYCMPRVARNLLTFRYRMLDLARARAAEVGQLGALFPWRTITGEEASAYYQAGTAQYHIDADVAYALAKYVHASGDLGALAEFGAEILVETARMWADLGFYGRDGRFHLHAVTGPDEYTAVVNDNAFTNVMARRNLGYAADVVTALAAAEPGRYAELVDAVGLRDDEVDEWRRAADAMYVPYDSELGIHPQDQHFLDLEPWDLSDVPADKFPLLLNFHPLVIYRFQVCKQADVLLAMLLCGDEFDAGQKRRNVNFYDPITTGDSSLSAAIHSIVAAEVGCSDLALRHFDTAARTDLADLHGNVVDGVHVASAGGVWMALVYGFAGLRDHHGQLSIEPRLPAGWRRLSFALQVHGRTLRVAVGVDEVTLSVDPAAPVDPLLDVAPAEGPAPAVAVTVAGWRVQLRPGQRTVVRLAETAAAA